MQVTITETECDQISYTFKDIDPSTETVLNLKRRIEDENGNWRTIEQKLVLEQEETSTELSNDPSTLAQAASSTNNNSSTVLRLILSRKTKQEINDLLVRPEKEMFRDAGANMMKTGSDYDRFLLSELKRIAPHRVAKVSRERTRLLDERKKLQSELDEKNARRKQLEEMLAEVNGEVKVLEGGIGKIEELVTE